LRHGAHSKRSREAVAASVVRRHADKIVEWDEMRTLLARR